ncbi:hypothetical protein L2D00_05900 [Hyphomonadaceae bacterium BL14]|nr:hypothetical protein L2D00_05900 [Hyphomonadaceae bacterium BL14]
MTTPTSEEERREKDFRRLRTRNPICLACGYADHPAAMEFAHIAPRKFHDDGGVLCSNCHREQSDTEKDFSYAPVTKNPPMEIIGRYLLALSEWLTRIGGTLAEFGRWLLEQAEHVLPYYPEGAQ